MRGCNFLTSFQQFWMIFKYFEVCILGYLRQFRFIPGYIQLSWVISGYIGLSLAISGNIYQVWNIREQVEAGDSKLMLFETVVFFFSLFMVRPRSILDLVMCWWVGRWVSTQISKQANSRLSGPWLITGQLYSRVCHKSKISSIFFGTCIFCWVCI